MAPDDSKNDLRGGTMRNAMILVLAVFLAQPASAIQNKVATGGLIESFNWEFVDDLLELDGSGVKLILFDGASEAAISSAHLALFKRWIESGGVGYFYADGLTSSLAKKLNIVSVDRIDLCKESGAEIRDDVGELFVKGAVDHVSIGDHRISEGVRMVYACPPAPTQAGRYKQYGYYVFDEILEHQGNLTPVLSVGINHVNHREPTPKWIEPEDETSRFYSTEMIMIAADLGKGTIVFDGTGLMSPGCSHEGKTYDWSQMRENILHFAD